MSYFYDKYGSFTVKISKYDMINQGLTLSETPDYTTSNSRLNADILYDMTNISGEDLPDNIDKINGSHNGEGYIAYTFYLINSGEDTLSYDSEMTIENVTNGVDEAIRVELFVNGEKDKYTVVIWLEGNDPDCVDKIIGGTMKLGMNFKIVETT